MANKLATNTKVQLVAGAVSDELSYLKASVDKMPQSEFKHKRFGKSYKMYIPDPGKVVEGLCAEPDAQTEIETEIFVNNFNTSVEMDAWDDFSIDNFTDAVAIPRGKHLGRALEQSIIKRNVYKNMQAVVSNTADFGVLSDAAAALGELAISGEAVSFMHPTVMGKISKTGLANFLSPEDAKRLYGKNALGEYGGAWQTKNPLLPTLKTPATIPTATITLTQVLDADNNVIGFEPVTSVGGTGLVAGIPYAVSDAAIVDQSGIETDQQVVVTVLDAQGNIPELRLTVAGAAYNNPNAWLPAGTTTVTLTPLLDASTTYFVGQVRSSDALCFSSYSFDNLPGSDNEMVQAVKGVAVKMSKYGEGNCLTKLVRFDVPHAGGIIDARNCVGVYVKK